ncbi:polysaccharide deacetylase family protein [Aliikangiella sp. G2MR2-5]|uniref:polysaccharide deacetylase family protein n=1 Tax=Aliikangiella sp. G2MR2-5 TaxID=2788943 RepID=UPI0018A899CC|nr:polysaccharide deacetylase family protein [Aliikangiella sp. G2MR2-5]
MTATFRYFVERALIALLFIYTASPLHSKEIALTFDDSPRFATGYFSGSERAKKLIRTLKQHEVQQVAFFSVSKRLDEEGISRLKMYSDAGHIIANHTHTHSDFNQLSLEEYSQDFEQADLLLRQFDNYRKWFRFPYLREGDTLKKRDGFRRLLKENGFRNAYITLNNYDWYMEGLFQKAIVQGEEISLDKMRDYYIDVLMQSIEHYDQLAVKHLGRSPRHVLLLHEMDISALFIGNLVDELRSNGWKIISPQDAYEDPIAQYQTSNIFKFNPGRIGEIAKDKGQKRQLWHSSLSEEYLKAKFETEVLSKADTLP